LQKNISRIVATQVLHYVEADVHEKVEFALICR